jgi:two-component system, OmpR family, phosphate regulon sensor histidine kinase PhoR
MNRERAGLFAIGTAMATPGLAALGVLAALEYLDPAIAAIAGLPVLIASLIICRQPVRDYDKALVAQERATLTSREALAALQAKFDTLASAKQRTERLIDHLPVPLIITGADRQIITANRAARRLSETPMVDCDLAVAIRHPVLLDSVDRARTTGDGATVDISLPLPTERTYAVHIEPFDTEIGDEDAAIVLYFQEHLAVDHSTHPQRDFVANVSHELRAPLAALSESIKALRGSARKDPEAAEIALLSAQTETDRVTRLIARLLSLSRIEREEHARPVDAIALGPLLYSIRDMLSLNAIERGMRLILAIDDDAPLVRGDHDQLTQAFHNLLDNAIKFGDSGTAVTATMTFDNDSVSVAITDQSDGVAPELLPRLTERFYRVDPDHSRNSDGSGLGLAIVKHVVNRHRGHLSIQSVPGQGSTFTVTLPRVEAPVPDF